MARKTTIASKALAERLPGKAIRLMHRGPLRRTDASTPERIGSPTLLLETT